MPSAGRNELLSVAELRWCMREDIRIEILETRGARSDAARFNEAARQLQPALHSLPVPRGRPRGGPTRHRRSAELDRRRSARGSVRVDRTRKRQARREPATRCSPRTSRSCCTRSATPRGWSTGITARRPELRWNPSSAVEAGRRVAGYRRRCARSSLEHVRRASASEARLFEATAEERAVIRAACSGADGVAGYNRCVESRVAAACGTAATEHTGGNRTRERGDRGDLRAVQDATRRGRVRALRRGADRGSRAARGETEP